jgi:transcription initiation factor IIE alpha subunit
VNRREIDPHLDSELRNMLENHERNALVIKRLHDEAGYSFQEAMQWVGDYSASQVKPCPHCGKPLRTDAARQCFECGKDWHHERHGS